MSAPIRFDPNSSRSEARRQLTKLLTGIDNAALDARLLLCAALGIDHTVLIGNPDRPIGATAAAALAKLARRRLKREPASRVLGRREFWGLEFALSPAVLDPRADTEILVEAVIDELASRREMPLRVLDLGIGSGAILAALLHHFPNGFGVGIDISETACRVARGNLASLGLARRAGIVCGDWASPLRGTFDAIVSNPPYIASRELERLAPEVRDHDPKLALDGGEDGLDAYRIIVPGLAQLAAREGFVALEIGAGQAAGVGQILKSYGFAGWVIRRDLAGHDRVVVAGRAPRS
jgi:release factor glutamine methyltransferase